MNTKYFLSGIILSLVAISFILFFTVCSNKNEQKKHTILVVSGWQDVNIGDIAHTPGLLNILQIKFPESKIILWKRSKSDDVESLLKKNFPKIDIIYGNPDKNYDVASETINKAIDKADLFIHGSGPYVVAESCLRAWRKKTDKPFGIFGVTTQEITPEQKEFLQEASFIYTRETESIEVLKREGVTKPYIQFAPDATFALNIRDDNRANEFLEQHGLEEKEFICVIPRLRSTPYWLIRSGIPEEKIAAATVNNDKWKEIDHAKAREAIIRWVRDTGKKVLICPEMTYQVDIMDELLIDPLPDDIKPFVSKRGYWMPDEAASVYSKAFCVLSFECHSPIIALANGTPAIYLRQPEDTIKGQMYYDLGYNLWVFEINETTGAQIADCLMAIYCDYNRALEYRQEGIDMAWNLYDEGIEYINKILER